MIYLYKMANTNQIIEFVDVHETSNIITDM